MFRQLFAIATTVVLILATTAKAQNLEAIGPFLFDRSDPRFVVLDGAIELGAADAFRQILIQNPGVEVLILNSGGGLVIEAVEIASLVFDNSISTYVPAEAGCYSACAYVFLAGTGRLVDGELGVHQFDSDDPDLYRAQVLAAVIVELLDQFDVAPEVRRFALTTPPEQMHIFTRQEIDQFGIERAGFSNTQNAATREATSGYRMALFVGLDFYGADLLSANAPDVGACAASCLSSAVCRAFTFNVTAQSGPNCFLKSSTGVLDSNVDALSGLVLRPQDPNPTGFTVGVIDPGLNLLRGMDLPGGDLRSTPLPGVSSAVECRLACVQNELCQAFSYAQAVQQCWIKGSISPAVPAPRIVSGIKAGVVTYSPISIIPLD